MKKLQHKDIINALSHPVFDLIGSTADALGLQCYVIGGWVRDLFLQRPSKDIDVVVVNPAIERPGIVLAEALQKKLGKRAHIAIYRNFGTAQLKYKDIEIEFVGARRESYDRNSRKPITEDGTLEEDQDRRDFTINAMALCLNHPESKDACLQVDYYSIKDQDDVSESPLYFGKLLDPFDGLLDLEDGIIATPLDPDITFSDDPLRMMRCIRFATQLNFIIEDETFASLEHNCERIKIISGERIADELNKIMLSPMPSKGFIELDRCGLLPIIFPELAALQGVEKGPNGRAHKDNFYHTLEVLDNVSIETNRWKSAPPENMLNAGTFETLSDHILWLRWAALLHDIGKPKSKRWDNALGWTFHNHNGIGEKMIPNIFRRMKLPMNEKMKYVQRLVSLHMRPIVIADEEVTDSAVRRLIFDAADDINDLMLLCTADITSKNEQKKARFRQNFELVREKINQVNESDRIRLFQPLIRGEEIMEIFGLKPSREVGILKNALKEAQLNMEIADDRESALNFLLTEAQKIGLKPKT